ncbi:hypothetical protein [Geomesophilobacter sediminis]|uniref:Uncharacterized protein n=1 Tax=Geomesophilobacter sediminis TaxID=2798584 RepID=A0A8J7M0K5_9BACT|nr:hypothetical protein [Geomesophilobacter sediminis]MBJ6725667.1 hypothetical protein [Geomesophilobacter sediminis]
MNAGFTAPLGGEPLYHFAGILVVICLAVLQAQVGRAGALWQIIWALPGTLLHELSHLLVAAVTGGRPVGFTILPRREPEGGWILGSVTISNPGPISALPSALAPLGLNLAGYFVFTQWGRWFADDLPCTLLRYLAVYLFAYSSLPSRRDLLVALSSPLGVALYGGGALLLGAYLWSV